MQGLTAPGSGADIAPRWLVEDSTAFSKMEHKRAERQHARKRTDHNSDQKGKG